MSGLQIFAPILAKYVQTSDSRWGIACIAMRKAFHEGMLKQVATRKWFWQFEHPAALIPLYREESVQQGVQTARTIFELRLV